MNVWGNLPAPGAGDVPQRRELVVRLTAAEAARSEGTHHAVDVEEESVTPQRVIGFGGRRWGVPG